MYLIFNKFYPWENQNNNNKKIMFMCILIWLLTNVGLYDIAITKSMLQTNIKHMYLYADDMLFESGLKFEAFILI